jgi:hypothetical protein
VDAGACEGHEDELGDLVSVIFKWNHEAWNRNILVVESAGRRVWLSGVECLECRPGDILYDPRILCEKQSAEQN